MSRVETLAANLAPVEIMAIEFLFRAGQDDFGTVIDNENQMCAGLVYIDLAKKGLVSKPVFPIVKLTTLGEEVRALIGNTQ